MLKKIVLALFIIVLTFLLKETPINMIDVFKELEDKTVNKDQQIHKYYISYENQNITTNNLEEKLKYLENTSKVKITIKSYIKDELIEYTIEPINLRKQIGAFFDYYLKILEKRDLEEEITKIYTKGIKINNLIITMPKIVADNYKNNQNDIIYEIN